MTEVSPRLRSDAERNRLLILHAAAEPFAEQGLDVAMAEIARRGDRGPVGCARGAARDDRGLQARDHAFFQATEEFLLDHPQLLRRHRPSIEAVDPLLLRAQEAGVVRDDVTTLDLMAPAAATPLPSRR